MNKFIDSLLFSFLVSLSAVMLDSLYHLATNTAVHINYILVKFAVLLLILFLTTYWLGKGRNQGIFSCIAGPSIFYLYYLYADPTLNRSIFKIDESFGYIFLHIAVMVISYIAVYNFILRRKSSHEIQTAFYAFVAALLVFGFDAFYQLSKVQLTTHNEELVTAVMSFNTSLYLLLALLLMGFLCFLYLKNTKLQTITYIIFAEIFIFLIGRDIIRTGIGILSALVPLLLLKYYESNASEKQEITGTSKQLFLLTFIITGIIGLVYTFLDYKIIKNTLHIGFGLRHNDHSMIGTIGLVIAITALYKLVVLMREK